jgi:hypothetical protein
MRGNLTNLHADGPAPAHACRPMVAAARPRWCKYCSGTEVTNRLRMDGLVSPACQTRSSWLAMTVV